ncbi:hypothetical protein FB451DRAFT_1337031 [Mycena latifolia]|nr:hypothetical protein FB451DRAFT_1337031 [Mycena latifolia]
MAFQTLVVNDITGAELSYIDSGAPSHGSYTTIFALIDIAPSRGVRVVALNRRSFPGSTPFTPEELNIALTGGSGDDERDVQMEARGHEIGTFIATFIKRFNLPPPSNDGKTGGAILFGWSLGSLSLLAVIGTADTMPEATRSVLSSHVRSLIVYETAPIALGLPVRAQNWNSLLDTTIPEGLRLETFGQWVTAYFDHANISTRDLDDLSWVVSSVNRTPTIYRMPTDKLNALTAAFGINGLWAVEDDQAIHGPNTKIIYKMMSETNHFGHWDDAEKTIESVNDLA